MEWVRGEEIRKQLTKNKYGVLGRIPILLADSSAWRKRSHTMTQRLCELIWAPALISIKDKSRRGWLDPQDDRMPRLTGLKDIFSEAVRAFADLGWLLSAGGSDS